jgi:hypothetical protein
MTISEFKNKYLGKYIDFDGYYGYQCVDVFRQYCKDVLKIPEHTGAVKSAKDLFLKYNELPLEQKYFDRYIDDFEVGDVIVFNNGEHGHVAIILNEEKEKVQVLEQDGYKQDGVKINTYFKSQALGTLRCKLEWILTV